jgi:hypothetical protein
MAGRRFGTTILGEEQVRVTVRLPKALYDDLVTLGRRRRYAGYSMLGEVIRRALEHYVECPEGLPKAGPRFMSITEALKAGVFSQFADIAAGSVPHDTPPPPPSTPVPTWKLGAVTGALKLLHTQHPDTPPTHEAILAICGKTLSAEEIDAILDALKRSGDYDRIIAS